MEQKRVLVLYNESVLLPSHPDYASEHEVIDTANLVAEQLARAGYFVGQLGVGRDFGCLLDELKKRHYDVVFNLYEGMADHGQSEAVMAGLLESLGIPFTGCPSLALSVLRAKDLTKYAFRGAGIDTPAFIAIDRLPLPKINLTWPVIAKPAHFDASVGLDQGSVVSHPDLLTERVRYLLESYGPPVLVEEFIAGREFNVGVIEAPELTCLACGEIEFPEQSADWWPIVTYQGKWSPDSADYVKTPARYPALISAELEAQLTTIALRAFLLLGCRDYARVDFRLRADGKLFVLEVNPNPDFCPGAGFAAGLAATGIEHSVFTEQLVKNALARGAIVKHAKVGPANLQMR
jgi:D-alanine-D-alanine ligase